MLENFRANVLNYLEHVFLKGCLLQGPQQSFKNAPSLKISWTWSDVFTNSPPCLLAENAKVAILVARPRKCYIDLVARCVLSHSENRSTNQIAENSLFNSEIILIADIPQF